MRRLMCNPELTSNSIQSCSNARNIDPLLLLTYKNIFSNIILTNYWNVYSIEPGKQLEKAINSGYLPDNNESISRIQLNTACQNAILQKINVIKYDLNDDTDEERHLTEQQSDEFWGKFVNSDATFDPDSKIVLNDGTVITMPVKEEVRIKELNESFNIIKAKLTELLIDIKAPTINFDTLTDD